MKRHGSYLASAFALFVYFPFGGSAFGADGPHAISVARATAIPACTVFVDAGSQGGDGTAQKPLASIAAAVEAAKPGAVICVAEGTYAEQIAPGEKHFTLAGGFQRSKNFKVRDSAVYITKAAGKGGSFLRIVDPGPKDGVLTAIDGFEITGYEQAIVRDYYKSQRFDLTNNHIHDNVCSDVSLAGAAFALNNISGAIRGNVIRNNSCGRGGAGFLNDTTNSNKVVIEGNLVDGNSGTEPESAHGGGFYFFGNTLTVTGNLIVNNSVTQWGGGLFIGAFTAGNQPTTATLSGNIYRANRAGNSGGGFFCDDGATCVASNEIYDKNCGGNIMVDGGPGGSGPTTTHFDHITSVGALEVDCKGPGYGLYVNTYEAVAPDSHTVTNAIFWGHAKGRDLAVGCGTGCSQLKVSVDHSMVQSEYADGSVKIAFGTGNIAPADPLFVAPDKGDFRLQPNSPAARKSSDGTNLGADASVAGAAVAAPAIAAAPQTATPPAAATAADIKSAPDQPAPASPAPYPVAQAPEEDAPAKAAPQPQPSPAPAPPPSAADEAKIKQAFDEAKSLGTIAAWRAFLASYPEGFYANMAGAYLRSLGYTPGSGAPSPLGPTTGPQTPALAAPSSPPQQSATPAPAPAPQATPSPPVPPAEAAKPAPPAAPPAMAARTPAPAAAPARIAPAVKRGARFFGFAEQFNRYYTEPGWKPTATIYAGPNGGGGGKSRTAPTTLADAVQAARPGTMIYVLSGDYKGGIEFTKEMSGTYDAPIVLYAEPKGDGSSGVTVDCAVGNRQTCFNFEDGNYIAVDGFELIGGNYGVRAVGLGFASREHSRGIAVLNSKGQGQMRDPFKTAQSDWTVLENNHGSDAKKGDGHGIYISGGSDWGIVRLNETHSNESSDLQINADPASTCKEIGIPYSDPRCDAYAGSGEGGQGASDYFLVEGNYCHRSEVGPNFTSLRRSMIRNNIFGPQNRHNATFWQETDNPKLGSTENRIFNNLFITTKRHAIKFENNSGRNIFFGNIVLGVSIDGSKVTANPAALLMETDATSADNVYQSNVYISGMFEGRTPVPAEIVVREFSQAWFKAFPTTPRDAANGFTPVAGAPFLDKGKLSPEVPTDMNGMPRRDPSDLGPIEVP